MSDAYSSASDYGGYQRSRGDIDYQYGTQSINNAYGRFLSQQRGQRGLGDMTRQFQRQYPRVAASFGQRGLGGGGINSGVQRQSMQRYIGDYGREYGRASQDLTMQLQNYDLNQANLDQWRSQAITDLEAQKAIDRSSTAATLEQLRDLLGRL